ncbi:MAG: hypothetical protein ACUVUU_05490 [bacterium]
MRKLCLLLFASVMGLAYCGWSYTFLDMAMGSQVFQGGSKCLGMGEVGLLVEDASFAAATNPASLSWQKGTSISCSYRFLSIDDRWSMPMHDSFDALLGYMAYSHNSNLYHDGSFGCSTDRLLKSVEVVLGVTVSRAYDFTYDFHEEVRDRSTSSVPSDKVVADAFIRGRGGLKSLSVGAAKALGKDVSLGVSLEYLYGDFKISGRLENIDLNLMTCWKDSLTETEDRLVASSLSGLRLRGGISFRMGERLEAALSGVSSCNLDGSYKATLGELLYFLSAKDSIGDFEISYPESYSLGLKYRPRNELATTIEADITFARWKSSDNTSLRSLNLDNTFQFNIGIEHIFYNARPVRFGFTYRQSPFDHQTGESAVTAGSGIRFAGLELDFAGKIGWREYRYYDLFDDSIFCAKPRYFTDKVEETVFSGMVTMSRRF